MLNIKYDVIDILSNTIYEHRHLFTDDFKYNSLVLSNLIGKPINLYSGDYHTLPYSSREKLFKMNQGKKYYMFIERWLYQVVCIKSNTSRVLYDAVFTHWDDLEAVEGGYETIPLLTLK